MIAKASAPFHVPRSLAHHATRPGKKAALLAYGPRVRHQERGVFTLNKLGGRLVALDHGVDPPHEHRRADEADRAWWAEGRERDGNVVRQPIVLCCQRKEGGIPFTHGGPRHTEEPKGKRRRRVPQRVASPRQNIAM
jgi:hypothetical protein